MIQDISCDTLQTGSRLSGAILRRRSLTGSLVLAFLLAGCGVSQQVHEGALDEAESVRLDLQSARATLESARAREAQLNRESEALQIFLDRLETRLAARETELDVLGQQNLELMNLHANQAAEIQVLQEETGGLKEEKEREIAKLKHTYQDLVIELEEEIKRDEIKISQVLDQLSVSLLDQILFDSGSADLKPDAMDLLGRLGQILNKVSDKQILIEGHTDNIPIKNKLAEKFPTNWELSAIRAINVVKFLIDEAGISPKKISAAAYSMNRPVASNKTRQGRIQNRRIEIKLLPADIDEVLSDLR